MACSSTASVWALPETVTRTGRHAVDIGAAVYAHTELPHGKDPHISPKDRKAVTGPPLPARQHGSESTISLNWPDSVLLVRPDRKDENRRHGNLGGMRQWIEAIIDTGKDQLNLEGHRARTPAGVYARIALRLLALAAAIWHNWRSTHP